MQYIINYYLIILFLTIVGVDLFFFLGTLGKMTGGTVEGIASVIDYK